MIFLRLHFIIKTSVKFILPFKNRRKIERGETVT